MTVSTTITKNSYSANGTLHSFAYGFKIFADADLTVIVRSSAGTETIKTLNTHYVVTNAGTDGGGNVLFKFNTGTPSDAHYSTTDQRPQSGETVVILRTLTKSQGTDYVENDPFPSTSHEDALDRLTFITQELQEEVDRTIKLSKTNTMTSPEFTVGASDRANKILAFDTSGELSVTQELGTYKGTDATVTTEAYVVRDIIKSTTAGQLNNVYICISDAVVGDSLTDTDHFELLIDAVTAATSATNAASSATASASSATAAASSASTASTQASNASTSASTASTQATNAASSATAASNAQAAAEAALDTFDDRFLGAKSSNPSVDNDGNALLDGALYFDTTNDIMKVYDLTNTQWRQLTLTSTNQNNVNTVAGAISNVNTVAGANSNISTVASDISNINTVAGVSSNITTVAGISSNVTSVAGNSTNINSAVSNATNINTVAGNSTNINSVAGSITNVNTVASNLASVNNFAEVYRIESSAPTTSLDIGDLYFDTTSDTLKVYGASGWQAAGSSVNGTSQRYHYDITGTPTSVTGADANGNTLTYDASYVDVYVNGVRMSTADVTVTSGDTVTFTEALADGDEVDIVGYGTFSVASLNADNLDSGTVPSARVSGAYTGITSVGTLTSFASTGIDDNASSTAVTIVSSGNVGIGTSSPSGAAGTTLAINGGSGQSRLALKNTSTGDASGDGFQLSVGTDGSVGIEQRENNYMALYTNATERMRITSDGNVLIGRTSELNDFGDGRTSLVLQGTGSQDYSTIQLGNNGTASNTQILGILAFYDGTENNARVQAIRATSTDSADLLFWTRPASGSLTERMRIDSSGNVGIGTSSPISLDGNATPGLTISSNGPFILLQDANNSNKVRYISNNTGEFQFGIVNDNGATSKTEHMRIDSSGHLMLNTTTARTGTNSITLEGGNSFFMFRATGTGSLQQASFFRNTDATPAQVGSIFTSSVGTSYNTTSDYRLKENVTADWDATTRLKQLNPVRFNFIADVDTTVDGFLAHEVQSVVPEAISGTHNEVDADGNPVYQGIDQSKIVPLLTKTILELEARIVALENAE